MAARKKKTAKGDLQEYRRKRDFDRTAEPRGGDGPGTASGRSFVVQKHAARQLHYDFRLELDGVLKSWAVPRGPSLDPKQKPLAVATEDHPIEYGSFEGAIPKGEYGGGTVMLWDCGEWEPIGDPHEGLAKGDLKFHLHGEKLRGAWVLARMKDDAAERGAGGRNWLLIKKKDEESRDVDTFNVQSERPFSVASGCTMEEIAANPDAEWKDGRAQPLEGRARPRGRAAAAALPDPGALPRAREKPLPPKIRPQLATSVATAPEGDAWLHEVKLDGYRLMCVVEDGAVRLLTRNGHDWTESFPAVARAAGRLPVTSAILDGEVVVLDADGHPDFGALQNAFRGRSRRSFTYFAFDVPYAQGRDLCEVPLIDRKTFLAALLEAAPMVAPTIQYSRHIVGNGPFVFEQARQHGLEGIISKKASAAYVARRSDTWLKVKCRLRQELVVGGYTDPGGARTGFGALLLGHYDDDGALVYCGRVGSGFTEQTLTMLEGELSRRSRKTPPFRNAGKDPDAAKAHWVRPELVCEVEFTAWTNDDLLRHAVYLGLREDVDPREVRREATPSAAAPPGPGDAPEPAPAPPAPVARTRGVIEAPPSPEDAQVAGVRISNPNRTVYPEARVTKGQVARYYEAVADWILPHIAKRPLSLVRCPLGLAGESFFQRHVGDGFPKSIRGTPSGTEIEGEPYVLIDDLGGLIALAQMGVLEIHAWGCRADDREKPDRLVFDLDPGEGIEWEHVVASARFVRTYLDDLGLRSFVKTTGGQGVHVVVPIMRRADWPRVRAFTHAVAKDIADAAPRNFVATMSKDFRRNRIYVDYLRNVRGATAVAAYSTRARPGACVSTPLEWDELSADTPPSAYTVTTVPPRLAALARDPWDELATLRQSITARMMRDAGA